MADDNNVELATGYVSLVVSTEGMGRQLVKAFSGADKTATAAGKSSGASFAKAFGSNNAPSKSDLAEAATKAAEAAEAASKRVKASYGDRDAAARRLKIAELQLAEAEASGTAKASQLAQAQDRVAIAQSRLQQATVKTELATSGLQRAQDDAAESARKVDAAVDDSAGSAERAGRTYQTLGQKIRAAFKGNAAEGLDEIPAAADDAGKRSGTSFGKGFGASLGSLAKVAGVGLVAAGAAVGLAAGKALLGAADQDQEKGRLAAKLGLDPQQATRAGQIAGKLYAGAYGESLGEVSDVVAAVSTNISGLASTNDATMERISSKILDVATAFDQDFGGVTRAVGQMLKTGLAKDADQALDLITTGFQNGANKSDDLLDTFNEYGTQFRKLGLDGPAALGLISQAVENGARDSDLAADALKEFSIRAIDGSKATADGFKAIGLDGKKMADQIGKGGKSASDALALTLDKLRGIEDPVARSAAATSLFGTQAEDLGDALFSMDLSGRAGDFDKVAGASDRMGKSLNDNANTNIESFKRQVSTTFINIVGGKMLPLLNRAASFLSTNFGPAFSQVVSFIRPAGAAVTGFFRTVAGSTGGGALAGAFSGLISAGRQLGTTLLPIIQKIATEFQTRWPVIKPIVVGIFSTIGGIVADVLGLIQTNVSRVTAAISFIWSRWGGQITTIVGSTFETVFSILGGAFKIIGGLVKVITGVVTGDWAKAGDGLKKIVGGIKQIFVATFSALRTQVQTILGSLISNVVGKFVGFQQTVDGRIRSGLARIKGYVLDPVRGARDALKGLMTSIAGKFSDGVGAISTAWNKLKAKAKEPINFIVKTVINDGLIGAFNNISGKVSGPQIKPVPWPPKGWLHGGSTGANVPVHQIAGVVHGNEHVATAREVMATPGGHSTWERIRGAIRSGNTSFLNALPGYLSGGRVWPTNTKALSGNYAGHSGVDIRAGMGAPIWAASAGRITHAGYGRGFGQAIFERGVDGLLQIYGHTSKLLTKVGQVVRAGQLIGRVGATGNASGPHLHFEIARSAPGTTSNRGATLSWLSGAKVGGGSAAVDGGGGSLFDVVGALTGKFKGILGRVGEIGDSPFAQIVKQVPTMVKDALVDKGRSLLGSLVGAGKGVAKTAAASAWAPTLITALKLNKLPLSLLDNWIRQVASESGGNPNAIQKVVDVNSRSGNLARGLLQVIPPTFAAYRSKKLPNNIFNPLANAYAAMNYARHRYNNLEAVIGHGHGYADGTSWAPPGMAWVGERGPELMRFVGGEQVHTTEESMAMTGGRGPLAEKVYIQGYTAEEIAEQLDRKQRRRQALHQVWAS